MIIWKMAWRNVWRNYRRSSITIAAMTLALFVELIYSGLVGGLVIGMEEDATAYELGDLQVFVPAGVTHGIEASGPGNLVMVFFKGPGVIDKAAKAYMAGAQASG